MKHHLATAMAVLLLTIATFAHGGATHVMGTVVRVSSGTIEVKTSKGKAKQVMFDDKTQFTKSGAKIQASEVKGGDRVVIEAHESKSMKGMLEAESVKVGTAKAQTATKGHSHSH